MTRPTALRQKAKNAAFTVLVSAAVVSWVTLVLWLSAA